MKTNLGATAHTRRSVLRTLAIGAGTAPFAGLAASSLLPIERAAYAQSGAPRRMIIIEDPNGLHERRGWKDFASPGANANLENVPMQGSGFRASSRSVTSDFTLGAMLAPLAKFKDQMVIFDAFTRLPATSDHHTGGTMGLLTAATLTESIENRIYYNVPLTQSVDQYIASKIGRMVTPKLPTLTLGVQYKPAQSWHTMSWLEGKQLVSPEDDTFKLHSRLFAGLTGGGVPKGPTQEELARLARRKSVLDSVTRDLNGFTKRLHAEDKVRAEAQLAAIRTLEEQLAGALNPGAAAPKCEPPMYQPNLVLEDPKNHMVALRMQMDLIVAATACDLTRSVTLYIANRYGDGANYAPIHERRDIHGCSHEAMETYVKIRTKHFEEVAYLAQRLSEIPEAGGSMLDHTLIVCLSECSHGHTNKSMPWLTLGGAGLGVKTGRYFLLPSMTPHKRLLVSLMNIMGLPDDDFGVSRTRQVGDQNPASGDVDLGKGPLEGFVG